MKGRWKDQLFQPEKKTQKIATTGIYIKKASLEMNRSRPRPRPEPADESQRGPDLERGGRSLPLVLALSEHECALPSTVLQPQRRPPAQTDQWVRASAPANKAGRGRLLLMKVVDFAGYEGTGNEEAVTF